MIADRDDICRKLMNGWKLFNRGSGWVITKPRRTNEVEIKLQCDNKAVKSLVDDKIISLACPFRTIRAVLPKDHDSMNCFGRAKWIKKR